MITVPEYATVILHGARLRLRPLRMEDAQALYTLFSDPAVTRYWSFAAWTRPAQALAFIELRQSLDPQRVQTFAIALGAGDDLIGTLTLFLLAGNRAEIGYALAPAWQGRGMAAEALRLAVTHAFEALAVQCIEADVDPRNQPSVRLLEGLGFRCVRQVSERWRVGDEIGSSAIFQLRADAPAAA
jgi:ribosomal-protein-alanine N-acetyltransferase